MCASCLSYVKYSYFISSGCPTAIVGGGQCLLVMWGGGGGGEVSGSIGNVGGACLMSCL